MPTRPDHGNGLMVAPRRPGFQPTVGVVAARAWRPGPALTVRVGYR